MQEKKEIINRAIELLNKAISSGVTNYKIAKDTKITEATIGNYVNGKTKPTHANADILLRYFENGVAQKSNIEYQIPDDGTYRLLPIINADAVGGMHKMNDISASEPEYIKGYIPFTDAFEDDLCIPITSDSMIPTCPPGCLVQIRKVERWKEYFGFGNLFILQLKDGRRILKEVTRYDPDPKDYILCVSHNKSVPDEELPKDFIVSVWKVIKVLTDRGW